MHKKHIIVPLLALGLCIPLFSAVSFNKKDNASGIPVEMIGDILPGGGKYVFEPASYSTSFEDEPYYTTQKELTFDCMNFDPTPSSYRGDSVKVAVIDSGINYSHEDFKIGGNSIINPNSCSIEWVVNSDYPSGTWMRYLYSNNASHLNDSLGHGTNVASVIASQINGVGCAGVAPNVDLYIYKVTNSSNQYEWGAIQTALNDARLKGVDVINMSFQAYEPLEVGTNEGSPVSENCSTILTYYINQCYNAGITLVGAAGNYNTTEKSYPASNNHVISVGSLGRASTSIKAGFSNLSDIDLVAPGYVHVATTGSSSAYKETQGTSFSSPIVAAAIALYKQQNPSATPSQIETALKDSCDTLSGNPSWAGSGRLNVARFLGLQTNCPTSIVVNNPEVVDDALELNVGDTLDLDCTVNGVGTFDDSLTYYMYEENGTASVDSNGRITALAEGEDYIIIESNADSSVYAMISLTVTNPVTVSSVTISPSALNLDLNGTKTSTLTATVNGTNNPSQSVTWTSSNTSVATVTSGGFVTGIATGNATITATSVQDPSVSGTCSVTVTDSAIHVTGVSLNKASTTIIVNGSETLAATIAPSNATNKSVTWTSNNTSVATVSNSGVVTGVAKGETTITVTTSDGGYSASCTVTVKTATTESYSILPSDLPTSYSTSTSERTAASGIKYIAYNCANYSTNLQFKASGGYIETTEEMDLYSLTITDRSSNSLTVYASNTAGSFSQTINGTNDVYDLTGYSYVKIIRSSSGMAECKGITIEVVSKELSSIAVKTAPTKTVYETGEFFNPAGLVITATYDDASTKDIAYANSPSKFTFDPTTSTQLTKSHTSVTITYNGKSTSQAITVKDPVTLSSISISGYTTAFVEGDTFAFGGIVTAHFSDNSSENVTSGATFTGYNMTEVGQHEVTVSYTFKGKTETAKYNINVSEGTLSSISLSGQTTSYQKNAEFSFDGTCTATFANGYQKVVTPTSVTTPNMSKGGTKEITVSYTYNGLTKEAKYNITVTSIREVIEETSAETFETVSYTSSEVISNDKILSTSKTGYTNIESNSLRLGSGDYTGALTISCTKNITKVIVRAKYYNTDSSSISIAGQETTLTSSYSNYEVTVPANTKSVTVETLVKKKRANIDSVKVYFMGTASTDIGSSEDCVGLEAFIDDYLHMDYTDNLGYCKDSTHHYYTSARDAFNALNEHQRALFVGNSAYSAEYQRLSKWAYYNGESFNSSNLLSANANITPVINNEDNTMVLTIMIMASLLSVSFVSVYLLKKKRKVD